MKLLSAIVPCYNEQENIADFYQEFIKNEAFFREKETDLELLFIDDGSKDATAEEVKKLARQDKRVHLISFSRNFGKEAAIYAGLKKAKGDYVVFLDADLQDPPSILPEMYGYLEQGYDSVATRRVTRKGEPPVRSFFCKDVLPPHAKNIQNRNHGRGQGLPAYDQTGGGSHSLHAGVQSVQQGDFWLGRL